MPLLTLAVPRTVLPSRKVRVVLLTLLGNVTEAVKETALEAITVDEPVLRVIVGVNLPIVSDEVAVADAISVVSVGVKEAVSA